jgi:hypothetical protein
MGVLVYATTTISDTSISTSGSLINFSGLDAIQYFYGNSSMLGGSPASGGISFIQSRPEAKAGLWFEGWDAATNQNREIGWFVCHYNSTSGTTHSHCSIETLDNTTGATSINTHFAITYNGSQSRASVTFPSSTVSIDDINTLTALTSTLSLRANTTITAYPNNQLSVGLSINNYSSTAGSGVDLSSLGGNNIRFSDHVEIVGSRMLILMANTTVFTCNSTFDGSIYYDGTTKKHYGCNSTTWNALY